jgi:hypothetical protein
MPKYEGECQSCGEKWMGMLNFVIITDTSSTKVAGVDTNSELVLELFAHHSNAPYQSGCCNTMKLYRDHKNVGYFEVARSDKDGLPAFLGGNVDYYDLIVR